ncbi:hypothetical protein [Phenylobacterium sp.]|uniref:hypothetical protein n=1 Tax=Phenylobacterium sp. TaxID=1871053 RepID=UPI00272F58AC|nr:hypothetical protein [Phenylobacterium sp.]MDP1617880.1 hypothetical protein [Phenylobacterium sp.]MDP1986815.1 hypothetical protein [Phenylobacterium sp.]
MAAPAAQDFALALVSTALDPVFYRRAYPDVAAAGADPIAHYVERGWQEGRDPAAWFSTTAYLADHADVAASGENPLAHFLAVGAGQGRTIRASALGRVLADDPTRVAWAYVPEPAAPAPGPDDTVQPDEADIPPDDLHAEPEPPEPPEPESESLGAIYDLVAEAFDRPYYMAENPDVAAEGADPVTHFLEVGWREGRDPTRWFSVSDYLELNPDVAAASINPFVHYLRAGRQEGRVPRLELGFRYRIIAALQPLEARIKASEAEDEPPTSGTASDFAALLATSRSGLADLHLTFSHDDYMSNLGGVQLCLQREGAAAAAVGRDHLHIYPANSRPVLRRPGHAELLGVVWNGVPAGTFYPGLLVEGLESALAAVVPGRRSLAVHSLLGHSVSDILAISRAAGFREGWFWVHDFAGVCASYHLLRNDVADCGAPPIGSAACGVCVYGPHRQFHLDEHDRLFSVLSMSVAAPSQAALDTWRRGTGLAGVRAVVAPLARLVERAPAELAAPADRPFRLAFPGMASTLKGWPVFRDLVLRFAEDPRYEFLHLARDATGALPLSFHPVTVSEAQPTAMQDTLEALGVDAVMIWSLCRETFSFTTYEAAAAGAAILTSPDTGNVAAFVAETGQGRVLDDEAALFDMFETGAVLDLRRSLRQPVLSALSYSRLTFDLLDGEAV